MPRPGLPPTPASSVEIQGKEHGETIEDFTLPPAALHHQPAASASSGQSARERRESDVQASPSGGVKRKRRSMNADMQIAAQAMSESGVFSLPPPPSRSRKIIQVQPEDASKPSSKSSSSSHNRRKSEGSKSGNTGGAAPPGSTGSTKSTAASRKTARKTAHSIIERRRRSKMNDEFETLKDLVPAARGQNMHKLAILQAGIEYVRYLEDCIHGLKGAQSGASSFKGTPVQFPADGRMSGGDLAVQDDDMEEDDEDDDMDEDGDDSSDRGRAEEPTASTPRASRPGSMHQASRGDVSNTPSPAIYPVNSHTSNNSYALSTGSPSPAILPVYGSHYSATAASSTLPSPALLPNDYKSPVGGNATPLTNASVDYHALQAHAKKALAYHGEADQEVIATLAMMGTERRRSQEERERMDGTRGMSVRDLLST